MRKHPNHAAPIGEFLDNNDLLGNTIGAIRDVAPKRVVDSAFAQTVDSQSACPSTQFEIGDSVRHVGEHEGYHYFMMDLVAGRSLASIVSQGAHFTTSRDHRWQRKESDLFE